MKVSEKVKTLEEVQFEVEEAAIVASERMIFKHAYLASDEAQRKTWAAGNPVTVLEGSDIVEIYPDGSRKIVGHSETRRVKVSRRKIILKL